MPKPIALRTAFAAAGLLLSACGGGGQPMTPDTVPASAIASPDAFTQYVATRTADDAREPLDVEGLLPPTSDTAEPAPVAR